MTHKSMNLRPAPSVACIWRLTGESRTPLACHWIAVEPLNGSTNPARIAPSPAETEEGGMRLCA